MDILLSKLLEAYKNGYQPAIYILLVIVGSPYVAAIWRRYFRGQNGRSTLRGLIQTVDDRVAGVGKRVEKIENQLNTGAVQFARDDQRLKTLESEFDGMREICARRHEK